MKDIFLILTLLAMFWITGRTCYKAGFDFCKRIDDAIIKELKEKTRH